MSRISRIAVGAIAGLSVIALGGCDLARKQTQQTGYRGTGGDQIRDLSVVNKAVYIPDEPYALPADGGPTAAQTYKNVRVLGGISTERFNHLMANISQWVAPPAEGCNYCHNPENMASDEKYTKVVARRMIQMTQTINSKWSTHVKQTGVTCFTCHRGNAVPEYKWAVAPGAPNPGSIRGNKFGQNTPDPNVGYTSLPYDPFSEYLYGTAQIRVAGDTALRTPEHQVSVKTAEKTYGLMIHMSSALGVNCTYCHNTQSFRAWDLSRPPRVTAYYGIRMVRDINNDYISSLQSVFPAYRKGPGGDPYKVNCTTCHQGQSKPLGGVSMIAQAPALKGPMMHIAQLETGAAPVPAPAAAPMAHVTARK